VAAAIVAVARMDALVVRNWVPALYVLGGYYLAGRTFVDPMARVESWLLGWDRRLLGDPTTRFASWPGPLVAYLDIVYMACFTLVPAGFAVLAAAGRSELADRYWTMILGAELGAFAPLPIIQTRPPWALEREAAVPDRAVHRVSSAFVSHATIGANTFPSGHVAGSLAIALALVGTLPWVGVVFLGLAVSIAVACVVGRYHYIIDVVAGAVLAMAIWAAVVAAGV